MDITQLCLSRGISIGTRNYNEGLWKGLEIAADRNRWIKEEEETDGKRSSSLAPQGFGSES